MRQLRLPVALGAIGGDDIGALVAELVAIGQDRPHPRLEGRDEIVGRAAAHVEFREVLEEGGKALGIARRILDPGKMRIFHQILQKIDGDRNFGGARDVIEVDRDRHRLEQAGVIIGEPVERRLVEIEGRDHQQPVGPHALGMAGKIDRLHDIGGAGADDDVHVALVAHRHFGDLLALRHREAGKFARGAEHDDPVGTALLVPFHHRLHGAGIELALRIAGRHRRHPIGHLFLRAEAARAAHLGGGRAAGKRACQGGCPGQRDGFAARDVHVCPPPTGHRAAACTKVAAIIAPTAPCGKMFGARPPPTPSNIAGAAGPLRPPGRRAAAAPEGRPDIRGWHSRPDGPARSSAPASRAGGRAGR